MTPLLGAIIKYLYPNLVPFKDYIIQDNMDGKGAEIAKWMVATPQPTQQEIDDAIPEVQYLLNSKKVWNARYGDYPPPEERLHSIILEINNMRLTIPGLTLTQDMTQLIIDIETVDTANPLPTPPS